MLAPRQQKAPVIPSIQTVHLPAPVGGLATLEAAGAMPANKAILLFNMIPSEYGLRARLGSREVCRGLTGAGDTYVRSILPFTGSTDAGSGNKLFATTSTGIWDVSESGFVSGSAYAAATAYVTGNAVTLGGQDYICLEGGTSHAGGAPPAWAASTIYRLWDLVTSSGNVYCAYVLEATSGSALMAPSGAGDFTDTEGSFTWLYVGPSGGISNNKSLPPPWAALTAYTIGSRVIFEGRVYHCINPGTSGATEPTSAGTGYGDNVTDGASVIWAPAAHNGEAYGSAFFTTIDSDSIPDGTATWRYAPENVAPSIVHAFADSSGRAGHGVTHVQVTAGGHFLLYWDEVNGLHVYTESTGLWAAPAEGVGATEISGVNPANLVAGTVWKGFIVHIERDSARVWFSDAGSIYGAASPLDTAFKLKAGGNLVCAGTWTYDAGAGMDDALVFVSRGGDVLVYQGTDPSSADTFAMQGAWQAGTMPAGRELLTDLGGEMLVVTRMGLLPMSKLVVGGAIKSEQYQTADIGPLFNEAMLAKASIPGWTMRLHPEENALMVTVPTQEGQPTTQLVMSLATKGWARYRDLDMYSSGVFDGKMYFGTVDGTVCINDGYVDGRPLYEPESYEPVQYSMIGAFQGLGNGRQKQIQIIRPYFMDRSPATFDVGARYDFDISELETVTDATGTASAWDSGLWDSAVWGGDYTPESQVRGACGMGVHAAIALRGEASDRTILTGFDVGFTQGGLL
jgi:hypothetical protein